LNKLKEQYRLSQKVKDDTFDVDLISQYNLLLQIGADSFRFCVADTTRNRCLWLEDYKFHYKLPAAQFLEQLAAIYDDHHVLKAGFWNEVKVCFKSSCFTLVPLSLFNEEHLYDYLKLVCEPDSQLEEACYYKHSALDAVNVYSIDKQIKEWFQKNHSNKGINVLHQSSPLIEGAMRSRDATLTSEIFINVEKDYFHMFVFNGTNLQFCNIFNYVNDVDFIYYVMFVLDELKLNADTEKVTIWGELMPDSAIYNKLFRYIRNLNFGTKPASLSFSYIFDEVFDHRYFDLYSMHLCK
jgi:hypothetical protein